MLRLVTAPNIVQAKIWCDLLCEAGLPATVLREHFASVQGLMPPSECHPEIWLEYEEHETAARQLLGQGAGTLALFPRPKRLHVTNLHPVT